VLPEHAVVFDPNDIVCVLRVIFLEVQQYLELYASLMLELLLVSDDLDRYNLSSLVVNALECLSKRSFAQEVNYFKPVRNLVLQYHIVIASLIIIAAIVPFISLLRMLAALYLLGSWTQEVAHLVVQDLTLLVLREAGPLQEVLQDLRPAQRQLRLIHESLCILLLLGIVPSLQLHGALLLGLLLQLQILAVGLIVCLLLLCRDQLRLAVCLHVAELVVVHQLRRLLAIFDHFVGHLRQVHEVQGVHRRWTSRA